MIDVLVTGQSLPALQTALDLAEVGLSVVVLEESENAPDADWEERDSDGSIAAFMNRVAEPIEIPGGHGTGHRDPAAEPIHIQPAPPLLQQQGEWLPQVSPSLLGIPAVPHAAETIALLGARGAFRAYLDRVMPLLTVGKTRLFGELVRKRMGVRVKTRLVDPQVFERFGTHSGEVEAAVAAPGLNETLSRAGTLSSAVLAYADRNVARETRIAPRNGAEAFRAAVLRRLALYGVRRLPERLLEVRERDESWAVRFESGEHLHVRAVVADLGSRPLPNAAIEPLVCEVVPMESRVYAILDMKRPEWLPNAMTAVTEDGAWSIGFAAAGSPGDARAQDSKAGICTVKVASAVGATADATRAWEQLEQAHTPSDNWEDLRAKWFPEATLRHVDLVAAPFRTLDGRDAAESALADLERRVPGLMVVGRAAHGDDQSVALTSAHASAVHLRRRLLGLEEA